MFQALQEHRLIRIRAECVGLDSTSVKVHPDGTGAQEEGSRELRIPTTDADLVVRYAYAEGRHRVDAPPDLEITLDVVGPQIPAIERR